VFSSRSLTDEVVRALDAEAVFADRSSVRRIERTRVRVVSVGGCQLFVDGGERVRRLVALQDIQTPVRTPTAL
jgi:hypothetical protein